MPEARAVVGIDPGADGGLCIVSGGACTCRSLADLQGALQTLSAWASFERPLLVALEDTHAFAGVSATANYRVGWHGGFWEGVAMALGLPLVRVSPARWQKEVCGTLPRDRRKRKEAVARVAQRLWPAVRLRTPRGRLLDGLADAICIAEYARRLRPPVGGTRCGGELENGGVRP